MKMNSKEYKKYVEKRAKKSSLLSDCLNAFWGGGLVCTIGVALSELFKNMSVNEKNTKVLVPVTLIFLSCLLTGLGVYDKIAKLLGAGTLVPITGFANAVIAPAIDCKSEGQISGTGAKMFIIAGPVIVYGTIFSALYGIVYYFVCLWA